MAQTVDAPTRRLTITADTVPSGSRRVTVHSPQYPDGIEVLLFEDELEKEITKFSGWGYVIEDQRPAPTAPETPDAEPEPELLGPLSVPQSVQCGRLAPPAPPAPPAEPAPADVTAEEQAPPAEPAPAASAPDLPAPNNEMSLFRRVPRDWVQPHPDNPRKHFDEGALAELAADIKQHGILQPLVVRQRIVPCSTCGGTMTVGAKQQPCHHCVTGKVRINLYQLVAGERRLRAAALAGLETVPIIVRDDLSDADVLACMMSENMQRADLNPIEQAMGFRAMAAVGMKQVEIAARLNVAQPTIANTLALLRLPDTVQALVVEGKLSKSHGQALARFAEIPDACALIAREAVACRMSSADLEKGVPFQHELEQAGLVKRVSEYSCRFRWADHCHQCPHQAYRATGGVNGGGGVCFRPACWQELETAAIADAERQVNEVVARAREQSASWVAPAPAAAPSTEAGAEPDAAPAPVTPPALPMLSALPWDSYQRMPNAASRPPGCKGDECEHLGYGVERVGTPPVRVCYNAKCHTRLKRAAEKAVADARKNAAAQLARDAAATLCSSSLGGGCRETYALAGIVLRVLQRATTPDISQGLRAISYAKQTAGWDARIFEDNYQAVATTPELLDILARLLPGELTALAAHTLLARELREACAAYPVTPRVTRWLVSKNPDRHGLALDPDPLEAPANRHRTPENRAKANTVRASAGMPPFPDLPAEGTTT